MKAKVAIFKTQYGITACHEGLVPTSYVQLTEWQDVDFIPLPQDQVINDQITRLDEARTHVVEEFTAKLASIDQQKAELLALPNMVQS